MAISSTVIIKNVMDVSINGVSLPEAGINGLMAGYYNVPVVFVAGDKAICHQVNDLFGPVETVAVKGGIGNAALNMHPEVSREKIKKGVKKALKNLEDYRSFKLKPPYEMILTLKKEETVEKASHYPGAVRTGDWTLVFKNSDIMEVIRAFHWMH